jgi:hypothetical protein
MFNITGTKLYIYLVVYSYLFWDYSEVNIF